MYWILFVMGVIVAVVLALVVGGLATPRHHTATRTMVLPCTPETVWAVVRDVARYGEWRQELEGADVVDTDQPQVRWRETTTRGSITFGLVNEEAPHRMVAQILDDDLPFTGNWTWQLVAAESGTRVSITERGSVGNPVFRFIGAHFIGHTGSIDRYLRGLAQRLDVRDATIEDGTPV